MSLHALLLTLANTSVLLASNPDRIAIGAIRWDGFMGPPDVIGRQEEFNLSAAKFHDRLPFFAQEISPSEARVREIAPDQMEKDIAFAVRAGIDYWAFNWYPPGSYFRPGGRGPDLSTALNLYLADRSPRKPAWCLLFSTRYTDENGRDNFSSWFPTFIGYFKDPNSRYQTVLQGRPLIYLFRSNITRDDIAGLRRRCAEAGVPDPFIVDMTVSSAGTPGTTGWSRCAEDARARGADAISSYVTADFGGRAYSHLSAEEQEGWDLAGMSGLPVVPWVTFGWDPRPRIETREVEGGYPDHYYPADGWTQAPTPSQSMDELQRAIDWCALHPDASIAKAVIIYAWDEITEGSNQLIPTLADGTQALDAAARVSGANGAARPLPPDKLAWFRSGDRDDQPAVPDAEPGILRRGNGAPAQTGSWMECDFKTPVAVDEIHLGRRADRISGFVIGYWDGSQWQQIYRADRAGLVGSGDHASVFYFPEVVTARLRLQFMGGGGIPPVETMQFFGGPGSADLALGRRYFASSQEGVDRSPYWAFHGRGWSPAGDVSPEGQWLEVDFGAMIAFDQVVLSDAAGPVTDFRLEVSSDGREWRTISQGLPLGTPTLLNFKRVTARQLRLSLLQASGHPLIEGFEVHCR